MRTFILTAGTVVLFFFQGLNLVAQDTLAINPSQGKITKEIPPATFKSFTYVEDLLGIDKCLIRSCHFSTKAKGFLPRKGNCYNEYTNYKMPMPEDILKVVVPGFIILVDQIHMRKKNASDECESYLPVEFIVTQ